MDIAWFPPKSYAMLTPSETVWESLMNSNFHQHRVLSTLFIFVNMHKSYFILICISLLVKLSVCICPLSYSHCLLIFLQLINLAASGLSCCTGDLCCDAWASLWLWHRGSVVVALGLSCSPAGGISFPWPGLWTIVPCNARQMLNHWITKEVPNQFFFRFIWASVICWMWSLGIVNIVDIRTDRFLLLPTENVSSFLFLLICKGSLPL